jgi:hypothetical protein
VNKATLTFGSRAPRVRLVCALMAAFAVAMGCRALFTGAADSEGTFSHKFHLQAMDVDCQTCHAAIQDGETPGKYMSVLDLEICARCHGEESKDTYKVRIEKLLAPRVVSTFHHEDHTKATTAQCVNCHTSIPTSTAASERNRPTMESCWTCHNNLTTLEGESGAKCALCHVETDAAGSAEKRRAFAQVIRDETAPADVPAIVMPPTHAKLLRGIWRGAIDKEMIPPDHNSYFASVSHGRQSMKLDAKCYACHFQRDCNECHQTTRPRDHTLRFEASVHGRMSLQRRDRCATCHTIDECASCHSVPPPGHTTAFRTSGAHASQAQRNVRSCTTCHAFEVDCAKCHNR